MPAIPLDLFNYRDLGGHPVPGGAAGNLQDHGLTVAELDGLWQRLTA